MLRLSIVDLLDNAIQHSPRDSVIAVTIAKTSEDVAIEVREEGLGVPPEHQDYVFERFYRVNEARSRIMGGAGLGLSIARCAAEVHGGILDFVVGEEGSGATCRIRIPRGAGGET